MSMDATRRGPLAAIGWLEIGMGLSYLWADFSNCTARTARMSR